MCIYLHVENTMSWLNTTGIEIKLDRLEEENRDLKQKIISDQAKIEQLEELVSILEEKKEEEQKKWKTVRNKRFKSKSRILNWQVVQYFRKYH